MTITTTTASSANLSSTHPRELSAFHSSFRADDTLIAIVPSFDSNEPLPLLSSVAVGPFQAGIPTPVPLWMALLLHQRSLCTISPPEWLNAANLSQIIAYEQKLHDTLFDDATRLPKDYYELANRLTGRRGISFADDNAQVLALLVQDLLDIRVDKLRQQLPAILEKMDTAERLILNVNGIGTQELAIFRPFFQQALNDRSFLLKGAKETKKTTAQEHLQGAKQSLGGTATDTASEDTDNAGEAAAAPRPRVALRRFRR